jgi:hypothetical protein
VTTLLWLLFAAWAHVARAGIVITDYCVYHHVDLSDQTTGDLFEADETPAIGVKLRIIKADTTYVDYWMDWNGSTPGCKSISLETTQGPFTIKLLRTALVNGNTLEVRDGLGGNLYAGTLETSFIPQSNLDYEWTRGPTDSINILAAASYAMSRSAGGVSGETFPFFTIVCPTMS